MNIELDKTLTIEERRRLAHIRMESAKWEALVHGAEHWDNAFLLRIIDRLAGRVK